MNQATSLSVSEEHRFWLEILEDHARFLLDRLLPDEHQWFAEADRYASGFAALRSMLDNLPSPSVAGTVEWIAFAKEVHPFAAGYYKLEGQLQALLLAGTVQLELPPSFLNGTLNENQEYLRLLRYYVQGAEAPALPLWDLMELWLDDQLGHAQLLQELAADTDAGMADEAATAAAEFRSHLICNKMIHGYLRFTPAGFANQLAAAKEAAESVIHFYRFIQERIYREKNNRTLNPFLLLFMEHQIPEASYFMRKLAVWVPDVPGLATER